MKTKLKLSAILLCSLSTVFAGGTIFNDLSIKHGLKVIDPAIQQIPVPGKFRMVNGIRCQVYQHRSDKNDHHLYFGNQAISSKERPFWTVAQWDSAANLYSHHGKSINSKTFEWSNWYKKLVLGQPGGGYRLFTLAVNGSREYRGVWQGRGDPCLEKRHPHLYIGQTPKRVSVGSLKRLKLKISAKKIKSYLWQGFKNGWNKNTATAHFVIQINFQNLRKDKKKHLGHGQSFGLGVNLFDVRNRESDYRTWNFMHKPRQRLIRYIGPNELAKNVTGRMHAGRWVTIDKDILPFVKDAFREAIKAGKVKNSIVEKLHSENLKDYTISSVNYGWEVSSLHDVEMHVSDFNISY